MFAVPVVAALAELFFFRPEAAVATVIIGLALGASRRPSRWLYLPSGAAFAAAIALAPFNHNHTTNTVGSLLLAGACAGLVSTFVIRLLLRDVDEDP